MRYGGNRHWAFWRGDIKIQHVVRILPCGLQHLRNYLIGASINREVVYITAAKCSAQRRSDLRFSEAECRDLIVVDHQVGLWQIDLQVGVNKVEFVVGAGLGQHGLNHAVKILERLGRGDHELNRKTRSAGQRWELESSKGGTGNLVPSGLQIALHLWSAACALSIRLEDYTGKAAMGGGKAIDLEHIGIFRNRLGNIIGLLLICLLYTSDAAD